MEETLTNIEWEEEKKKRISKEIGLVKTANLSFYRDVREVDGYLIKKAENTTIVNAIVQGFSQLI